MPGHYDPLLVALSYVIAVFGGYVALDLAHHSRDGTAGQSLASDLRKATGSGPGDKRRLAGAALALGAGRTRPGEAIDAAVGFSDVAALGEAVGPDRPLAWIHARTEDAAEAAARALDRAYVVGDGIKAPGPIVPERIA